MSARAFWAAARTRGFSSLRSSAMAWLASRTWWRVTALAAISRTRQELSRVAWMIAAVALSSHAWIRPRAAQTRGHRLRPGHATITETMDTYGHLFPDAEDLGRGAIDAIFAMPLTEQGRNQESR